MKRIGVLISGRGTNLQAMIDAERSGELGGTIVIVISNKTNAIGVKRAQRAGIQVQIVTKKTYPDRGDFDRKIIETLRRFEVDLVVLAGYMRMFTKEFIDEFSSRIINVHPSLLPSFRGVRAQWQAIKYGVRVSGCSTHFVTFEMDAGPIILQKAVPVLPDDTGETLAQRILVEEHKILVKSVRLYCEEKLSVVCGHVKIEG
jgi:phosphoribosylglycinamide formyltransferase-1